MEDTTVHALDYVSVLNRRRWWLLSPILASIVVGIALVQLLPRVYRTSAYIGVTAPGVSPTFVGQQNPLDDEERMRAITQQLVSPTLLTRVMAQAQLGSTPPGESDLRRLRSAISITLPQPVPGTQERRLSTFVVSYKDSSPERAQLVTNTIAEQFVDESTRSRAIRAEDTSAFISAQLTASQTRLSDLETALRREKERHMGRLPEQTQANLQTLAGLRQQLESTSTALRGEQDRLSITERQIDSLTQGSAEGALVTAARPNSPESRLLQLEKELAAARTIYTDKHPEVVRLKEEVASANAAAAADRQRPANDRLVLLRADPAYRQLVADRETSRLRIRELQRAERDTRAQIGMYQSRVESAPRVEQQLIAVQRDYDLERQQYADLSARLRASTIAESVERNGRGEQFRIVSTAPLPDRPVSPVTWQVLTLSLLAGIALGVGLSLLREYLDRSVHSARDLRNVVDVPILGEIGRIGAA